MPAPPCLFCLTKIYSNSRAVTCDKCQRWHHIRCGNTVISEEVYDEAVRNQDELRFVCMRCRHYGTSDDDMDVHEVVHVPRVPMHRQTLKQLRLLCCCTESPEVEILWTQLEQITQRQCLTLVAQSVPWSQKQKRRKLAE
ncbi:hypothetical protein DPMN_087228 [Dreissena polymorpha]|uniref:PHD-type domain-containing protein n=1 Tax=Dreissena polymorpha TaxID=45954 RepID=A0A9D4KTS8_DREPO|nr:hypothetical protein DPMN_087228 [Dreissena polymorpha]